MSAVLPDHRVRFTPSVILTREEAFDACQALADADRCLIGLGHGVEATALGALFDLLEDRLTATQALPFQALPVEALASTVLSGQALSGSYSMESEFTQ